MSSNIFLLLLLVAVSAATDAPNHPELSQADEDRAFLPVPPHGSPLLGSTEDDVPKAINAWLHVITPEDKLQPCDEFGSMDGLNDILTKMLHLKHPRLQEIYTRSCDGREGCDNRALDLESIEDHQDRWQGEKSMIEYFESTGDSSARDIFHKATLHQKCFDAVMIFQHHLGADARAELLIHDEFVLPLLPDNYDALKSWDDYESQLHGRGLYPVFAQQGYSNPRAANGKLACANCHLNQKPTDSPNEDPPNEDVIPCEGDCDDEREDGPV